MLVCECVVRLWPFVSVAPTKKKTTEMPGISFPAILFALIMFVTTPEWNGFYLFWNDCIATALYYRILSLAYARIQKNAHASERTEPSHFIARVCMIKCI